MLTEQIAITRKFFNSETEACLNVLERVFEMKSCVDGVSMNIRQLHSILVYLKVPEELYDFSAGYFGTNAILWNGQRRAGRYSSP